MDLLIVRHAIAFERDRARWYDDTARPLTPAGIRRARHAAAGLRELVARPQRLLTSPLVRALQTARILHETAGWPEAEQTQRLAPGEPPLAMLSSLSRERAKLVAVVGHQPDLGHLLALCLLGDGAALPIELKKNGVVCVGFNGAPRAGKAALKWFATPRMLRAMR